jgi:hypothetical protein
MIAALILVFAMVALGHFAFYYWRALVLTFAAQELSERIQHVSGPGQPAAENFKALLALQGMCPELEKGTKRIGAVATYYRALSALKSVMGRIAPAVSNWADQEMSTCTRYAAVVIDQRLQHNFSYAAQVRSL